MSKLVAGAASKPLPSISEVNNLRSENNALRREVEGLRRAAAGAKAQLDATQNQLRQAELAQATTEEYARKLEKVY